MPNLLPLCDSAAMPKLLCSAMVTAMATQTLASMNVISAWQLKAALANHHGITFRNHCNTMPGWLAPGVMAGTADVAPCQQSYQLWCKGTTSDSFPHLLLEHTGSSSLGQTLGATQMQCAFLGCKTIGHKVEITSEQVPHNNRDLHLHFQACQTCTA